MNTLYGVAWWLLMSVSVAAQTSKPANRTSHPVDLPLQRCPNVLVYHRGAADSFALPIDPAHPGVSLAALLSTGNSVAYDDARCDVWFGDTFYLDSCVICSDLCSATVEITMRSCGAGRDCNDEITIGQAPFGKGGAGFVLSQSAIDPNGCPDDEEPVDTTNETKRTHKVPGPVVVKRIALDLPKLRELVCKRKVTALDVLVQDDQIIDSMRLIVTRP
ncbi:MAG TPA: hypothetical protein VGF28_19045 [Thermoanaerobaculia bacterium]|jgi:hypothetical protein